MTDASSSFGWTSYTPLTGSEPPNPWDAWRTATITDATDPELAELRRRIVDPVVASVLTADELESVLVYEVPGSSAVQVRVVARGEGFHHQVQWERRLPVEDVAIAAERFADELENFACESDFGWGVQRVARYEIPPSRHQ